MKKFFLIAAAAAMVLSSCSKNTVSEDTSAGNAIGFGTYSGTSTKAGKSLVNGTTLVGTTTETAKFGVWGYLTLSANWATTANVGFMSNQMVEFDGTKYSYAPVRYWPKDEANNKLSFYAYYPYNGAGITPTVATGLGSYKFAVQDNADSQVDFMVSDIAKDQTYSATNSGTNGLVKLTFHHMLTKVGVVVKTTADASTTVKVTSITFSKINNEGTLTPAETANTSAWSATKGDKNYSLPLNTAKSTLVAGADYTDICATTDNANVGDLLMIPQKLATAADVNLITINYDYSVTANGVTTTVHDVAKADLKDTEWKMNQYVLYKLNLDLNSRIIKFTAVVTDWDAVKGSEFILK